MKMEKYSAINIGPIIPTLDMARTPRELWAASYLFSYLMKCIIKGLPQEKIISPATFDNDVKNGVGLYPDRVFVKGETIDFDEDINPVIVESANNLGLNVDYFNVMVVSDEFDSDSEAIKGLNKQLDLLELFHLAPSSESTDKIRSLIKKTSGSPLVLDARGEKAFPMETLGEIAAIELKDLCDDGEWSKFVRALKSDKQEIKNKAYNYLPKNELKSYHKYICVVQADGDNIGKTVSNSKLPNGKVKEISDALLQFGKDAKKAIEAYGGFPIYAGGDDLLFIAPVVGRNHTDIFQLLDQLNNESFGQVQKIVNGCNLVSDDGKKIRGSLSFGVSITYYKYPLYEALGSARKLLFEKAKQINKDQKNNIVVDWRKHSGGSFYIELFASNTEIKDAFENIISVSAIEESVVSAISHKMRESSGLFKLWMNDKENIALRNKYFFQHYLEYEPDKKEEKKTASDLYKDAALELLNSLFNTVEIEEHEEKTEEKNTKEGKIAISVYSMLRIAKFINGEDIKDE